jgi:hypothetical protein
MNQAEKQKLRNFMQEISHSMTRQQAERDLIKEICLRAKEEIGIEPKKMRQLGKILYENSLNEIQQEVDELVHLYESALMANTVDETSEED